MSSNSNKNFIGMDRKMSLNSNSLLKRKTLVPSTVNRSGFKAMVPWEDYAKLLRRNAALAKENSKIRAQLEQEKKMDVQTIKQANDLLLNISLQDYLKCAISAILEDYTALTGILQDRFQKIIDAFTKLQGNICKNDVVGEALSSLRKEHKSLSGQSGNREMPILFKDTRLLDNGDQSLHPTPKSDLKKADSSQSQKDQDSVDISVPIKKITDEPPPLIASAGNITDEELWFSSDTRRRSRRLSNRSGQSEFSSAEATRGASRATFKNAQRRNSSSSLSGQSFHGPNPMDFAGGDEFAIRSRGSLGLQKRKQKKKKSTAKIIPCKSINIQNASRKTEIDSPGEISEIEVARDTDVYEFSDNCSDFIESPIFHRSPSFYSTSSPKHVAEKEVRKEQSGKANVDRSRRSRKDQFDELKAKASNAVTPAAESCSASARYTEQLCSEEVTANEEDYEAKGAKPKRALKFDKGKKCSDKSSRHHQMKDKIR